MDSPVKPPRRREKYTKDTTGCGLLVSVIKTLDASETNEQRQKEKQKIEREFKKTDQVLNELVSKHDGDLTQIMHLFGTVSGHVATSRERIHTVKENLNACKQLLCCRREELKKLWMDAMQQKYVLELMQEISDLRKVPSTVASYTAKRQYLHATKSLTNALSDGPLQQVEGLSDLRKDLKLKQAQLYNKLHEELNRYLYQMPNQDHLVSFRRHGSSRGSSNHHHHHHIPSASPFQRNVLRKSAERAEANSKVRKALLEMTQGFDIDKTEVLAEDEIVDSELNQTYFFGIAVECFALLEKIPESLETVQVQIEPQLMGMVTRTARHMLQLRERNHQQQQQLVTGGGGVTVTVDEEQHPLLELLDSLFEQFKAVAEAHALLLKSYSNVIPRYALATKLYDVPDFWVHAQVVLQNVLTDYLDIASTGVGNGGVEADQSRSNGLFGEEQMLGSGNLSAFFGRRKISQKRTLFKFDKLTASSPEADRKEHRRTASDVSNDETIIACRSPGGTGGDTKKQRERVLVCTPDMSIIREVYLPLMRRVADIENIMKTKSEQPCSLHQFLAKHVKESFLEKGHNRSLQLTLDQLTKTQDAWKAIVTPEEIKRLGLSKPLLQSTVLVETKIRETKNLIRDLPNYSEELLKAVCGLLKSYRETCQAAYRGIVQPETEDKRIYSVAWLKDEDISRFLKSLPNWTDLKSSNFKLTKLDMYQVSEDDTMTQIDQRNVREAEMLTSNLGEGGITQQEILSDVGVLKELAILQQSMEWFSLRISEFARDLRKPIASGLASNVDLCGPVTVNEGTIKVLTNLALEFDELANTCLLVLHLEVRVQCFHYLQSFFKEMKLGKHGQQKGDDSLEPDAKVLKLTKVLSDMDEAFTATLHPRKVKYIFEGLAHLNARILMMASNYVESVEQVNVQRMCRNAMSLQQTLSSITAIRETALDDTRMFYEMLYMDPQEILRQIAERGPQFSEMQYFNVLQLICKSRGLTDQNMLSTYQQQLSDLLGSKPSMGVTV